MSQVLVRNLEPSVVKRLKQRAKANSRSLEEELRILLREAVADEGTEFVRWLRTNAIVPPPGFRVVDAIREDRNSR
jgi:plasmid stability protein